MRRISKSAYADVLLWGCNPGFIATDDGVLLVDTPQQPIDAVRWREQIVDRFGPIRHLVNTEPHPDHIRGNAYFPGVEVLGQEGMVARYQAAIPMMEAPELGEQMKQIDQDSFWLFNHPGLSAQPADADLHRRPDAGAGKPPHRDPPHAGPHGAADRRPPRRGGRRVHRRQRLPQVQDVRPGM